MNKPFRRLFAAALSAAMLPVSGIMPNIGMTASAASAGTVVRLNPADASPFNNGEFEGWGTSMGWWGNRLGHSDKMAQQAAEDLYSENGLSLDIVRYNVGGGDNPTHNHINRSDSKLPTFAIPQYEGGEYKADGTLNADVTNFLRDENGDIVYTYDWEADHDQMNVLKRIKEQNPNVHIEGYTNSPPWFMTNSQCSSGGDDTAENLDPSNYNVFAKFLADVTEHMDEIGLTFDSYSPMNEPEPRSNYWRALSPKQEGNLVAPGANQSGLIKALKDEYTKRGIDTLVAGMDETDLGYTISSFNALTPEAKEALDRLDTHTYGGSNRAGVKAVAEGAGKNLWMSEVDGNWNGFGLADRIITDLNGMQASAWVLWDIVDFHKDSKFVDPTTGNKTEANASLNVTGSMWGMGMGNHDNETVEWANKYYAFGQFTRYINPGDTLIASSNSTLAAYNKKTGAIKIVVNNSGSNDVPYVFDMSAFVSIGKNVTEIRSNNATGSNAEHWKEIKGEAELDGKNLVTTAKAGTITTYLIERNAPDAPNVTSTPDTSSTPGVGDVNEGTKIITDFSASGTGLSYSYTLPEELSSYDAYFAVYDKNGALAYVSKNKAADSIEGDFEDAAHKLLIWSGDEGMTPVTSPIAYPDINNIITPEPTTVPEPTDTPEPTTPPDDDFTMDYAIITGGGNEIKVGASVELTLKTTLTGGVTWTVSDETLADVVPGENGKTATVTAKASGTVKVYATVGGYTVERTFEIPMYKLSGTPSWGNDSNAPADSADYRKAADGDLSTYFDGTQNGWVMYDYGAPYHINEIQLAARAGLESRTVGGKVQASNDAINWTDIYTISKQIPAGEYTYINLDMPADASYRYYRYTNPDDMTNIAEFKISGYLSDETPKNDPVVTDIAEFTDDFEGIENIFGGVPGDLSGDEVRVYASGLERFGNVLLPMNTTAVSELGEAIELGANQLFRLQFNMFAGWENNGKDNTFAIKDADGNEIVALYLTGGGYNLNQLRIGGNNVLTGTPVSQCRSNPGSSKSGANGWDSAGQEYRNNMGYNKSVEIIIKGSGAVSVSFTGGMADVTAEGVLSAPVSIKSLELTGACNASRGRIASYDNFDGDVITYSTDFAAPTASPEPTATPEPTDPPVLPEDGTLISLDFDNGDLTSSSSYGKASGTPTFAEVDGRKVVQFNNTASTVITLTDANGNGLLAGQEEVTISFSIKPTNTATSWWFFTAPNANAQTYQQEHYVGALTTSNLSIERYNGGGSRAAANTGDIKVNEWNDVIISISENKTELYVNGTLASSVNSSFKLSDILGTNPVAYIGKANWGTGEYATGYMDNFMIRKGTMPAAIANISFEDDLSAVTGNITVPQADGVTWESSDPAVVGIDGTVVRQDETKEVTLTATLTENGVTYTRTFTVTVLGLAASADTFTAYAEGNSIKFTSEYSEDEVYRLAVSLAKADGTDMGNIIENTASGSFKELENGTYKVKYALYDKSTGEEKKAVTKTVVVKNEIETAAYLFTHFVGNESSADHEQIYFSVSTDGQIWTTINSQKPILVSTVGEKGVRDPHIIRGEDGKFFVIATDLSIYNRRGDSNRWGTCQVSGSKSIVIWESDDLVNWSEARLIKVAPDNAGCTWAPEAVYDAEKGMYMVFWASKTSTDNYATQRMYRSYTADFVTFTEPEIYIDGGNISNIDTTIIEDKGVYYRFTKNESKSSVTMMASTSLDKGWKDVATYTINGTAGNTVTGYEGPTIYKMNGEDKWTLLLDYYSKSQGYKPFVTTDITKGIFTSASDFKMDMTYRHGTVMPITQAEYERLVEAYK